MASGQSTYLWQVRTSPAGTVSIYAPIDATRYSFRTVTFGEASVRVDPPLVDVEAARSGGLYVLTSATSTAPEGITRYRASGTVDTLYAMRGVLAVGSSNTRLHEAPSGHLYVLGAQVARYTPEGQPDTDFASRPAATVCPAGLRPRDLYAETDGALVLCAGSTGAFVSRITAEGDIRADYGDAGRASVATGTDGRLHLDRAGNARVHTRSGGVFSVSALDPAGRPLHAPVTLPESAARTFVFDDGTTWMTSSFSYPRAAALGLRGVTPDGRAYGPWPIAPPIVNRNELHPPSPSALVRSGETSVTVHYGYHTISLAGNWFYTAGSRLQDLQSAPSPSPPPALVSPLGGYAEVPTAPLVWRRVPGATGYDVSLESYDAASPTSTGSMDPPVNGFTTDTTLAVPISMLSNRRFAWRVRSRGTDGRAGAWSSYATFDAQLPKPILVTRFGGRRVTSPVTLIWNDLLTPTSLVYPVTVSNSRTFATTVWNEMARQGTPTVNTPVLPDGLYYWRLRAMISYNSAVGPYSDLDSFVVATATGLEALPEAPVATSVTFPLWLSWSAGTDATAYDWQVSPTSGFETIADSGRSVTPRVEAHVPGGAYYWRVRGRSGTDVGAFSGPAPFSVAPPVPVVQSPEAYTPLPVTVAWQASAGAERYRVHIRSSNVLVLDSLVSASQTSIAVPLTPQRSYTVTVAAESGTATVWSAARSFTTQGTVSADSPERSETSVVVAPNPAAGDLVVRSASSDVLRYELVSILGAVVARGALPEGETTVPRNGLSPGVYVLRVYQSGHPAQALRVVLL